MSNEANRLRHPVWLNVGKHQRKGCIFRGNEEKSRGQVPFKGKGAPDNKNECNLF